MILHHGFDTISAGKQQTSQNLPQQYTAHWTPEIFPCQYSDKPPLAEQIHIS